MAQDEREGRVRSALSSLVQQLIRPFPGEDGDDFDERLEGAYELASSILESRAAPAVVADCENPANGLKSLELTGHSKPCGRPHKEETDQEQPAG